MEKNEWWGYRKLCREEEDMRREIYGEWGKGEECGGDKVNDGNLRIWNWD